MFRLRFTPNFRQQQKELLSTLEIPKLNLPPPIDNALSSLERESVRKSVKTPADIWQLCYQTGLPIYKRVILSSCLASFSATGASFVAVNFLKKDEPISALFSFAFAYFAFNLIGQIGNFFTNRLRAELSIASKATLTALISRKILKLSASSAIRQSSGNLKVLITSDIDSIAEFLNNTVRNLIPSLISILVMSPFLIHFSGPSGWVGLATLFLIIPVSIALNKIGIHYQHITQARNDIRASLVGEWVKNIRLIRFLSWDESFETRIQNAIRNVLKSNLLQHIVACVVFGMSTTWWMITGASVLISAKLFHYPLQVNGFFGSLWLLTFISGLFTQLPNTIRLYGRAIPSVHRISKLLSEPEQEESYEPGLPLSPNAKPSKIIFDQVCFRYPDQTPHSNDTLQELSIEIRLAQKTAILGEVGSGKTTFLKLLSGEFPPTQGKIWIEFEDQTRRSLWEKDTHALFRAHLGVVPQVPYVSTDLFSHNIALENEPEESEILNSIQKAEMLEDLDQFEDRFTQMIGESGVNLSGGQRQRLNLARAFHSKRSYLVLDDTLSAVDHRTETALMETLGSQKEGLLLVTHRLSEIKRLGYVLVFQNGKLIESGKPEELAATPHSAFTRALEAYRHG